MPDIDFNNQADPGLLLLQNSTETQNLELLIQGAVGQVLQAWSQGATDSINSSDAALTSAANAMSGKTGNTLQRLNVAYQTLQTEVSNVNNQYSSVMQGAGTSLTDLTDVEAQNIQFCSVTSDNQQNTNQLIMAWAG